MAVRRSKTSYSHWDNLPIAILVHATQDYVVFIDNDGDVDWASSDAYDEADRFPEGWGNIQNRFAALEGAIDDDVPARSKKAFRRMLAEGVARGLEGDVEAANKMLDDAEKFVAARNRELGRLVHMRWAGVTAAVVITISAAVGLLRAQLGTVVGQTVVLLIMCAGAGSMGALFSVLRNMGTAPDPQADSRLQRTEAVARILVGGFGAVLATLAVRAGVVLPQLGTAPSSLPALLLISVVAGISERLVPDLIRRLDGSPDQASAKLPNSSAHAPAPATPTPPHIAPSSGATTATSPKQPNKPGPS